MKRKTSKTGFTIIELILVMTIIGVLMSIAVPTYLIVRFRMVEEKARFNLNAIYSAQKSYHWELDTYAGPGQQSLLLTHVGFSLDDEDWTYAIKAASATTFSAQAQNRKDNTLYMYINQNGNITTSY